MMYPREYDKIPLIGSRDMVQSNIFSPNLTF